ncbi:MAG: MFS transporter [Pseudomonas sp.]
MATTPAEDCRSPLRRSSQARVLLAINLLYIGFGTVIGVVQGGLPPILRQQGHGVGAIGWVYALYLPFGIAFLWAHYIDRLRWPFCGRRTGWIVAMQAVAVGATVLLAAVPWWPIAVLALLGFVVTLAMATMDTALDALAVEEIDPEKRPLASGLKLAALAVGAMIGNGAFVIAFGQLGWTVSFLLLAGMMVLLALPVMRLSEAAVAGQDARPEQASLLNVLRDPVRRTRLALVTLISCVIFPLAGLNRVMLVDLGVPLSKIGWIVGTLGPVCMLLVSVVAMGLMAWRGVLLAFSIFGVVAVVSVGLLAGASMTASPTLAIVGSIATSAAVSGVYVTLMAKIIGWSAGGQPATDYAAYYGISRFASTVLTIVSAQFAAWLAWGPFYAVGLVVLGISLLISGRHLFRRGL